MCDTHTHPLILHNTNVPLYLYVSKSIATHFINKTPVGLIPINHTNISLWTQEITDARICSKVMVENWKWGRMCRVKRMGPCIRTEGEEDLTSHQSFHTTNNSYPESSAPWRFHIYLNFIWVLFPTPFKHSAAPLPAIILSSPGTYFLRSTGVSSPWRLPWPCFLRTLANKWSPTSSFL